MLSPDLSTDPSPDPATDAASALPRLPAARIVERLGGVKRAAELAGRSQATVYRWLQPMAKGGTGGAIPRRVQARIIEAQQGQPDALALEDFLPRDGEAFL